MEQLREIHNSRAPQQWAVLSKQLDWQSKRVIDLGCGYADLLFMAAQAGATGTGIDHNVEIIQRNKQHAPPTLIFATLAINAWIALDTNQYDVGFFFSVQPYLVLQPLAALYWLREHCAVTFVEIQTLGDGPGYLSDDAAIKKHLLSFVGWNSVLPIGSTLVKEQRFTRTIWKCETVPLEAVVD